MGCFDHQTYEFSGRVWILRVWCVFLCVWKKNTQNRQVVRVLKTTVVISIYISMRRVYFPTWIVDVYTMFMVNVGIFMYIYTTHGCYWSVAEQDQSMATLKWKWDGVDWNLCDACKYILCTYVCICWLVDRTGTSWIRRKNSRWWFNGC